MAIKIHAPAKVNLCLHVIDKRPDNYHSLQSIVSFADFGDALTVTLSDDFSFRMIGPYADTISNTDNLVIQAIKAFIPENSALPPIAIILEKNIPVGAGLGGGSSDAAAMIKALQQLNIEMSDDQNIEEILLSIGADVPACYYAKTCLMEGIGESITPLSLPENIFVVIIHPNMHCATPEIFAKVGAPYTPPFHGKIPLHSKDDFLDFIQSTKNDLTPAALQIIPSITEVLSALEKKQGCIINRMSGSGSSCFGIFETYDDAQTASKELQATNPDWFVKATILN